MSSLYARLPWWLLLLGLLGAPAWAQTPPAVRADLPGASPGVAVRVLGSDLGPGVTYSVRLRERTVLVLGSATANANGELSLASSVPSAPPGNYSLELASGGATVAAAPFRVLPSLVLAVDGGTAAAGRSLRFSLQPTAESGDLEIRYFGRVVFGPTRIDGGSAFAGRFVLPTDGPTGYPALVHLRASLRGVRGLRQTGQAGFTAQAPRTSPFLGLREASVSQTALRSNQRFRLDGALALAPDTGLDDLRLSAWWVGNDGSLLPLSGTPRIAADGSFQLGTAAPSLGSFGHVDALGSGRIRLVGERRDLEGLSSRPSETVVVEGPNLSIALDLDPDVDVNVIVRGIDAQGQPVNLPDALVWITGGVPLVDPTEQPTPLAALTRIGGPHQFSRVLPPTLIGQNTCPETLYHRRTNDMGRAEFLLEQATTVSGLSAVTSVGRLPLMAVSGVDCYELPDGTGKVNWVCPGGDPNRVEFQVSVLAGHLGYGHIDQARGGEIPQTWNVLYDKAEKRFTITDLRTGQVREAQTSANLAVSLPLSPLGTQEIIGDPSLSGLRPDGSKPHAAQAQPPVRFVRLPDFGRAVATLQFPFPHAHRMEFRHLSSASGELQSARLEIDGSVYPFTRVIGQGDCPSAQGPGSLWRLDFPLDLAEAMRRPASKWPGRSEVCGAIKVLSGDLTRTGSRQVCFRWGDVPSVLKKPGLFEVTHRYEGNAQYLIRGRNAISAAQASTMPSPPPEYNVGERRNRATREHDVVQYIDDLAVSKDLSTLDTEHRQFSRNPAAGKNPGAEASLGGSFGSAGWTTLLDQTFPLFKWYWGVPEVLSAEVFAELRLLAQSLFNGRFDSQRAVRDLTAAVRFNVFLTIGVDIDVLFGLLVDAGASISGYIGSEMRTEVRNGAVVAADTGLFFVWGMFFSGWLEIGCVTDLFFDPTCWIPNIEENYTIASGREEIGGASAASDASAKAMPAPPPDAEELRGPLTREERRQLTRHPALAYDGIGNGMALALDRDARLVATPLLGRLPQTPSVLSTAIGIRNVEVLFFANQRAVAVWVESTLGPAAFRNASLLQRVSAQRLHFAEWNGQSWTAKQPVWSQSGGDAHPSLARCLNALCGRIPAVMLAFSHRHGGALDSPDQRTWYASFTPGTGFAAPRLVDASSTPRLEVSPSVTYVGTEAVIGFVRYGTPELAAVDSRRFHYRFMGATTVREATDLPRGGMASPSLRGGSGLQIAFTRADAGTPFVGTRQALHFGSGSCSNRVCSFQSGPVLDSAGRRIYGQAPRLLQVANGEARLAMRGFGFGPDANGRTVRPGDPLGTANLSGDLLALNIDIASRRAGVQGLSNNGLSHFQAGLAFDALAGEVVAISSVLAAPAAAKAAAEPWRDLLGAAAGQSQPLATLGEGDLELNAVPSLPDPALEALGIDAERLGPGQAFTVSVTIGNRGAALPEDAAPGYALVLRLDGPEGPSLGRIGMPALAAGETRVLQALLVAPQDMAVDRARDLYALLLVESDAGQLDGGNDSVRLRLNELPVPVPLGSETYSGAPFARIGWAPVADERVIGYRIYAEDQPGERRPLGSSDVGGFVDLSLQWDAERSYYITSYSANGRESDFSEAIRVRAPAAPLEVGLFGDGFE